MNVYPPPSSDIGLPRFATRKAFYVLGIITIIGASFQDSHQRVIWTLFGVAFLIAADKIKHVEHATRRAVDLTEIRMQKEINEGFADSLESRYKFFMEQMAKANQAALKQVSTYVRDTSPTRSLIESDEQAVAVTQRQQ